MEKKQTEVKNLKPGSYVIIDNSPCRVDDITISKPGKHGGAKARLVATGIFDGIKRSIVKPADTRVDVPIIEKKSAQVIALIGKNAQLMDLATYEIFEVSIPEGMELKEGDEVLVWKFGANVQIKEKK